MKNKKTKYYIKYNLIGLLIGGIIFGSLGVYAALTFPSNDVSFDPSNSTLTSTNVKDAIDELYKKCTFTSAVDIITDLLPNKPDELYKDDKENIRYYGANPNNYIRFNNELWRIIGVVDGKIKIIKNESIGNKAWASGETLAGSNNWNNSDLKSYLNGEYYNSINSTYRNMISEETYYLGTAEGHNYNQMTASEYYDVERSNKVTSGNPLTTKQHIGLMYPSDYGYAAGSSCLSTIIKDYNNECAKKDYLFWGKNDWLQTPYISSNGWGEALMTSGLGYIIHTDVTTTSPVRPALYLSSDVQITGGTGTQSDPYQISL